MKNSRIQEFGVPSESNGVGAKALKRASIDHVNVNAHVEKRNLHRTLFAVTIFVVMLALGLIAVSCGKSGKSLVSSVNQGGTGGSPVDVQNGDRVTMSIAGPLGGEFVFEPLDGDGTPDEKGEDAYQLKLKPGDGEGGSGSGGGDFGTRPTIELTITAKKDMRNSWKYALGYIEYDADKYNPVEFIPGDLFGNDEKDVLNAALFQEKGRIAFWCGLKNFDKKDAKPGGDIGSFVIELVPWEPPKDVSTAPDDEDDAVFWFNQFDSESQTRIVYWSEVNRGDGDVSGEVYISDLTPLAQHHLELVTNNPLLDVIDYDDNDEVNCTFQGPDYDVWLGSGTNIENIAGYYVRITPKPGYENNGMREFYIDGPTIAGQERADIFSQQTADNPESFSDQTSTGYFKSENGAVGYWWNFVDPNTLDHNGYPIYQGDYTILFAPYDSLGAVCLDYASEFEISVDGPEPPGTPPVANLTVEPHEPFLDNFARGTSPFTVSFDASGSYDPDDPELEVSDRAYWVFEESESIYGNLQVQHIYHSEFYEEPFPKYIYASVTVFDDDGLSDSAEAIITLESNMPPHAILTATPLVGDAPLTVYFDASASYDNNYDGYIENYSWDWDGVFNWTTGENMDYNSGSISTVQHMFDDTGYHMAILKVTDDKGAISYEQAYIRANPVDDLADEIHLDRSVSTTVTSGTDIVLPYYIEENAHPFTNLGGLYVSVFDINNSGIITTTNNFSHSFKYDDTGFLTNLYPRAEPGVEYQFMPFDRGSGIWELQIATGFFNVSGYIHPIPPGNSGIVGTITIHTNVGITGLLMVNLLNENEKHWYTSDPGNVRYYFLNPDFTPLVFNVT